MDILRLAGPPGVGKSAVAWAVVQRLAAIRERVAYVDIDQLAMCYPAPDEDPERWALRDDALARITHEYRQAGVERLVVSGVASPDAHPPRSIGFSVRYLWLDATNDVRRSRLAPRGWNAEQVQDVVDVGGSDSARLVEGWERLPTDDLSVDATADIVVDRWITGPASRAGAAQRQPCVIKAPVLWITGPRCVGASMVGWAVAQKAWTAGRRRALADAAQLDFTWNIEGTVGLRNLVALHQTFSEAGAESLVITAPLRFEPTAVRSAFAGASVSFIRLDASEPALLDRALARTRGEGPMLAGDDLAGASAAVAERTASAAAAERQLPIREGEIVVDTTSTLLDAAAMRVLKPPAGDTASSAKASGLGG